MAKRENQKTHCLNCEKQIENSDKFCSNCGQQNRDLKVGFWELISEFLSSNFNFDTKLGRTLTDLLFKPGEITRQFNLGKRVRYVKPVQLYLFMSFIYFLLVGLDPASFVNKTPPSDSQIAAINESEIVDVNIDGTELDSLSRVFQSTNPNDDAAIDSLLLMLGEKDIKPWKRHIAKQAIKSLNSDNEDALTQEVYANLSIAMLLLLPVFAMLIWIFNKGSAPFYMDSLMFSLHFHTVVLFAFSINILVALIFDDSMVFKVTLGSIFVYLILSMRRVFELTWLKSFGKSLGISLIYSMVFGVSYLLVLALSFWKY